MKKQILLPTSLKKELTEVFKVGRNDVQRALTYTSNSNRARMLRAAALQRGGLIYPGQTTTTNSMPDCETVFDSNKETITQSFCKRLSVRIFRRTNSATICIDQKDVATFEDMTTERWNTVLNCLQRVTNVLNS